MDELEELKMALKHARKFALTKGVTMRKFASICKITPTRLSQWTGSEITSPPDVTRHVATDWDEQKDAIARDIMAKREERERILRSSR